nr:nitroreductase family protein [Clostridium sp. DL-VIII]
MNEVIQNILTRRSVRAYTEEQISDDDLNTLLEAAKFAPSDMALKPGISQQCKIKIKLIS